MANPVLLQQFYEELAKSPNFKYLSPEKQEGIRKKYANATDAEVTRGIEIVRRDTVETKKEIEELAAQKKVEEEQKKAKQREKMLEERKQHEKIEKEESERKSQEILEKLMEVDTSENQTNQKENSDQKSKKLFGLF
ncbi:hypothetical protein GF376_04485 [Candidatus Peregrinibacteria bacterium]|nr:hypothetical protein [Candidatus Peregrinibacteria bacterium]